MVVDSPLADEASADEQATPLWFVLWRALEAGMWRVWNRDNGRDAVATNEADGEQLLAEAKKTLAAQSKGGRLAAVELRLAHSPANEL